ncbi:hypothetical protein M1M07_07610 [Rhodococcus sp. HM1]|uniref:hypothetical protein n=1 Tax=Rhodococcus sp. HM1 TaxID=2937759 RepID=UPI00200A642A|nr:hypothetical protein [Rhodococcus sp. HM1]MCK8670983.1 hypothetical protein [Rhodococcus sp. HM1]
MYTLDLGYTSPPITLNSRMHWAPEARIKKQIRRTAWALAKNQKLPTGCAHVTVGLHYRPERNRRMDEDNLTPILKAACDGLVDAGLVADDTPDLMAKLMPVIHPAEKGRPGSLWLTVTIGEPR